MNFLLTVEEIVELTGLKSLRMNRRSLGNEVAYLRSSKRGKDTFMYEVSFEDLKKYRDRTRTNSGESKLESKNQLKLVELGYTLIDRKNNKVYKADKEGECCFINNIDDFEDFTKDLLGKGNKIVRVTNVKAHVIQTKKDRETDPHFLEVRELATEQKFRKARKDAAARYDAEHPVHFEEKQPEVKPSIKTTTEIVKGSYKLNTVNSFDDKILENAELIKKTISTTPIKSFTVDCGEFNGKSITLTVTVN